MAAWDWNTDANWLGEWPAERIRRERDERRENVFLSPPVWEQANDERKLLARVPMWVWVLILVNLTAALAVAIERGAI